MTLTHFHLIMVMVLAGLRALCLPLRSAYQKTHTHSPRGSCNTKRFVSTQTCVRPQWSHLLPATTSSFTHLWMDTYACVDAEKNAKKLAIVRGAVHGARLDTHIAFSFLGFLVNLFALDVNHCSNTLMMINAKRITLDWIIIRCQQWIRLRGILFLPE